MWSWLERQGALLSDALSQGRPVSRAVHGVRVQVLNTRPDVSTRRVFARAEAVLGLVARYQPARFAHLRRDLAFIAVERFACRGAYFAEPRVCLLELTFMANPEFNDAQVAATLVHEAMHARLDRFCTRFGVPGYPHDAARHERICRRAELDFGRRVPGGEPVVERALATMALADAEVAPAIDWHDAAARIADADADRGARGGSA